MTNQISKQKQLAVQIAQTATRPESDALRAWAFALMELRGSNLSRTQKAKAAIAATYRAKVAWPMVKVVAKQIKSHGWEKRTLSQRLGIGTAAATLTVFGGANAGIAALGGAIGVPLWIVFGAGAMFARHLYEELSGQVPSDTGASYTIDAKKKEE